MRFIKGDRVSVRYADLGYFDGEVTRIYGSGAYRVRLDKKPTPDSEREGYYEVRDVFPAKQESLLEGAKARPPRTGILHGDDPTLAKRVEEELEWRSCAWCKIDLPETHICDGSMGEKCPNFEPHKRSMN